MQVQDLLGGLPGGWKYLRPYWQVKMQTAHCVKIHVEKKESVPRQIDTR